MFEFIGVRYRNIIDLPEMFIGPGVTVITGASGTGKTTILKLLNKMISPDGGRIIYKNRDTQTLPSVSHRRNVTMLSQAPAIFEGSIRDNLCVALRFQEKEIPGDEALRTVVKQVRLGKELDEPANDLSGGEKQRLALGRILLLTPEVYLLDEPSSALDNKTEDIIIRMVLAHAKKNGRSVVMVTHSMALAREHGDRIIELKAGEAAEEEPA